MTARRTLVPACLAYATGLPAFEHLIVLQLVPMAPPHLAQEYTQVNLEWHPPLALQPPQPPQTLTLRTTVRWHRTTVLPPRCCVSPFQSWNVLSLHLLLQTTWAALSVYTVGVVA